LSQAGFIGGKVDIGIIADDKARGFIIGNRPGRIADRDPRVGLRRPPGAFAAYMQFWRDDCWISRIETATHFDTAEAAQAYLDLNRGKLDA
jgi:hypothetical protein